MLLLPFAIVGPPPTYKPVKPGPHLSYRLHATKSLYMRTSMQVIVETESAEKTSAKRFTHDVLACCHPDYANLIFSCECSPEYQLRDSAVQQTPPPPPPPGYVGKPAAGAGELAGRRERFGHVTGWRPGLGKATW